MTTKDNSAAGGPGAPPASPPCLAHESDDSYAGYMPREELIGLLNRLLEAERAGTKTADAFRKDCGDQVVAELLERIGRDQERFCNNLSDLIERLGGTPSGGAGTFFERAIAIRSLGDRLAFFNRGQVWMVERLREALPKIRDDEVHAALCEILTTHEHHIDDCGPFVGPEQATS